MTGLADFVPDADSLLAMEPEELAAILLRLARDESQRRRMFHPNNMHSTIVGTGMTAGTEHSYAGREQEVDIAIAEAWNWLRVNSLVVPASGANGQSGWLVLSRRGAKLATSSDFDRFRQAAEFPKFLLHASIADKVWLSLARGDLDNAVFTAFKEVEVAVRRESGLGPTDIGVPLMRKAFDKNSGPLTDLNQPEAERDALGHLFAGAIGSYKNPHSHRTVSLTDAREAQEMVLLASHLLRIVEARRKK